MKKFLIKVNGNEYEVEVEEVLQAGETAPAAPQPQALRSAPAPAAAPKAAPKKDDNAVMGSVTIQAPMPGTVLKISAKPGDAVKKGQVLLILEAMKMENEITAPKDGTVSTINVEQGAPVSAGDVMISMN